MILKPKFKKAISIFLNIIMYLFFAVCIFAIVFTITAKKSDDGAISIFGKQARIVMSGSMEKHEDTDTSEFEIKHIPLRSMVFIETVPENDTEAQKWYSSLRVGDVLTIKYPYAGLETITHRITDITAENGEYIIILEGDNKSSDASTLTQKIDTSLGIEHGYVVGKVVGQSYILGLSATLLKSNAGIICIVIIPCLIIAIFETMCLVEALAKQKKLRECEKQQNIIN